jgi:hypothetical protein
MSVCLSLCMSFSLLGEIIWKLRQKKEFIPLFPPDVTVCGHKIAPQRVCIFYTLLRRHFSLGTHEAGRVVYPD